MSFLQVASWNIEHLGGSHRADRKQSAFALADYIEMASVDIIALQEVYVTPQDEEVKLSEGQPVIQTRAVTARRNSDLDIVCYLLEEHLEDEPWAYHILPNRQSGDKSQLCAVMWNKARVNLDDVRPIAVTHRDGNDNLWDRKPHVLDFTSNIKVWRRTTDGQWHEQDERRRLSLVPLHMKSNYGGVTKNRRVRAKEAKTLCEELERMDNIDPSLVLIGDTNILNNAEPAIETFVESGFVDLNNNDSATYWSPQYNEAPFDRAFVSTDRPEFRYTRQYVLRSSDLSSHDRYLSDHYMIKISIKDYVDDIDPR